MSVCEREKERKVSPIVYNGHCFNLSAYYDMHAQNSLCRLKFCTMINLSFSTSYTTTPVPGGVHTNITVPPVQHWSS